MKREPSKTTAQDVRTILTDSESWPALRRIAIRLSIPHLVAGIRKIPVLGTFVIPLVERAVGRFVDGLREKVLRDVDELEHPDVPAPPPAPVVVPPAPEPRPAPSPLDDDFERTRGMG